VRPDAQLSLLGSSQLHRIRRLNALIPTDAPLLNLLHHYARNVFQIYVTVIYSMLGKLYLQIMGL